MRNLIINLLFKLLGFGKGINLQKIGYLFGASSGGDEARKKRWKRALSRVYADKHFIDWLYYQSESDKEKNFQGKFNKDIFVGARLRTLFIVYSARMAYLESMKSKRLEVSEKNEIETEIKKVNSVYKEIVGLKN